jgi:assimilatory nitrate reductase catalytic subunit
VDIFREHAALSAFENCGSRDFDIGAMASLTDDGFDNLPPFLWPMPEGATKPQPRFFADGGYFTSDYKAHFIAPDVPMLRGETSAARPLRLNTGRIRDQWHTMTRTGLSPRLGQHLPEPYVEIHPADAMQEDIVDGGYARLATDLGQCILKVVVSERQQRGMLFAPIHWSEENSASGRVGALVAPFTDPFSGQPENKATPVAIEAVAFAQRGFVLSRKAMSFPKGVWWSRVAVTGGYGYLLASNLDVTSWRTYLSPQGEAGQLAEYGDAAHGIYRAAQFSGDTLEACLFIGPTDDALDWDAVKVAFAAETISDEQRRLLLSGKSADGVASDGPVVCACFGVGRNAICGAIAEGSKTVAEIGTKLKAGTNCGSCIPELKRLIAQTDVSQPMEASAAS